MHADDVNKEHLGDVMKTISLAAINMEYDLPQCGIPHNLGASTGRLACVKQKLRVYKAKGHKDERACHQTGLRSKEGYGKGGDLETLSQLLKVLLLSVELLLGRLSVLCCAPNLSLSFI